MNKNIVIGVIVVIVLALGGWWLYSQNAKAPTTENTNTENQVQQTQPEPTAQIEPTAQAEPNSNTTVGAGLTISQVYDITYTDAGYSPQNLTIKAGDEVIWTNKSSGNLWTGSAMHPTHMVYSGTNLQAHCPDAENNDFDQCKNGGPGTSWSFTFTKTGTWGYHNHANSTHFGKITVE